MKVICFLWCYSSVSWNSMFWHSPVYTCDSDYGQQVVISKLQFILQPLEELSTGTCGCIRCLWKVTGYSRRSSKGNLSWDLGLNKMAVILQKTLWNRFYWQKIVFWLISQGQIYNKSAQSPVRHQAITCTNAVSIGTGNSLVPCWWQTIVWTPAASMCYTLCRGKTS